MKNRGSQRRNRLTRLCEEERHSSLRGGTTKQSLLLVEAHYWKDCFAKLAMTTLTHYRKDCFVPRNDGDMPPPTPAPYPPEGGMAEHLKIIKKEDLQLK